MSKTPQTHNNPSKSPLTLEQVRRRTRKKLHSAVSSGDNILLDSEPGSGKTAQLPGIIDDLDSRVLYLTARGELYDQMEQLCKKEGVNAKIVPRLYEDCPVFASSPNNATEELAHLLHKAGISGSLVHEWVNLHSGTNCQFVSKAQDFEPEQHQVLIGHYSLANLQDYTSGRTVVIDEFPEESFITQVENPQKPVTEFLKQHDIPYSDWTDLLEHRNDNDRRRRAKDWFFNRIAYDGHDLSANPFHVLSKTVKERHVRGALLTVSMLFMSDLGNGFETTSRYINSSGKKLPENNTEPLRKTFFSRETCVRNRESSEMWILSPPDLSETNGVIGLDGTPTKRLWNLVLDVNFEHRKVLSETERETYFSEVQNYTIKQANDSFRHNSSGRNMTQEFDRALFDYIEINEPNEPCLIAPDSCINELEQQNLLGSVKSQRNFADIRSSNAFHKERLGVIPYALHPGDEVIKRWGALFGHTVTPDRSNGLSYGHIGNKIYQHMVHNRILQAIYRFGRDGSGATVYLATGATPQLVQPDECIDVRPFKGEEKRAVSRVLRQNPQRGFTAQQVTNRVDCTPRHVRTAFQELLDNGYVDTETGLIGTKLYTWDNQ